ncbi:hypothetical protein L2E82_12323 [Cichorium intybus]|uniref:Uncharacterized protein n=1 Tax=Cichorium intybus TaxID=13427 RepID=A0ACB9GGV4_CICIN|nr:hypothetical protein L2E82_12323 [Cichorium intybus]
MDSVTDLPPMTALLADHVAEPPPALHTNHPTLLTLRSTSSLIRSPPMLDLTAGLLISPNLRFACQYNLPVEEDVSVVGTNSCGAIFVYNLQINMRIHAWCVVCNDKRN